jgi:hypothetical protein
MKYFPHVPLLALLLGLSSTGYAKGKSCLTTNELNKELKKAVADVDFENIIDLGPTFTAAPCPATEPACQHGRKQLGRGKFPQIDLAVIAFQPDCTNAVVGSNVFFSRDFPRGIAANFDSKTMAVSNVKMYRWIQERFDEGQVVPETPWFKLSPGAWNARYPADDLLNTEAARGSLNFMSPYPASVFKILVALRVLQKLEELGPLEQQLNNKFTYDFGTPDPADDVTLTFAQFLDAMIQWSGNKATAALIQYLHKTGDIVEAEQKDESGYPSAAPSRNKLNELYASLGLPALQMNRTRMQDGLWGNRDTMYLKDSSSVSHIFMPAWDTARLLWLLRTDSSTPENQKPKWQLSSSSAKKVNVGAISENVKRVFWANMKNQLFHEVLSNTLHCKQKLGGVFGIPALLPQKWVSSDQLRLPVGDYPFNFAADELKGDYDFTKNLGECQSQAEVEFASKTGLTSVSGSHAGLVKGLSERGFKREYIVVLNSSLGSRFTDLNRLDAERVIPCFDKTLCYSSRINQLGANIDASMKRWLESDEYGTYTTRNFSKTKGK